MKSFAAFFFLSFCFLSAVYLISVVAQAQSNGVYIVYTGAPISSSTALDSAHILSPSSMGRWNGRVVHRYRHGFSGFAARLSEEEARLIARRPEVVSVFPDPVLQLHTTRSWGFLKEQSGVNGFRPKSNSSESADQDVIIAIIDTGIWPEAKSFNDEGIGPIPKRWKGKCIEGPDFKSSKCNRKLIGARNYVTNDNVNSPRDHNGHGTHVAAIAAGRPVRGASYHGLASGTAKGGSPGSRIAVYRVCNDQGCNGSAVLKAFDDAIDDGVDVISVSFGYNDNGDFTTDTVAIGAFHAFERGIIVVGSAGDSGTYPLPQYQNISPWILTVGATSIDRFFESDVVLGGNKLMIKGGGIHFGKSPVIHPLIDGLSAKDPEAVDDDARNCVAGSLDKEKVRGKIVVCNCTDESLPAEKLEAVTRLDGIGVMYVDGYGQLQLQDSFNRSSPLIAGTLRDGEKILSYLNSTSWNPVVTISPTVAVEKYKPAPYVAYFSMRGPIFDNDYLIKPDIGAPGVNILSAWPSNETDTAFNILSGTSMACPHVSGIAATVKSQHPSWGPSAIKSAIMTTASQTSNLKAPIKNVYGSPASPSDYGAGEVTSLAPLQPGLVYETKIVEYLRYLCYSGYNVSQIKLISSRVSANFSCPRNSRQELMSNINYPSIAISLSSSGKTRRSVKRTVTNVGDQEETTYRVSVETTDNNVKVQVSPSELKFMKKQKKQSYVVTFIRNETDPYTRTGSITWRNDKYQVRIPFVVD